MDQTNTQRDTTGNTNSVTLSYQLDNTSNNKIIDTTNKPLWYSLFYSNTSDFKEILKKRLENKNNASECITEKYNTTAEFDYTNYLMTYFKPKEDIDRFTYNYYPCDSLSDEEDIEWIVEMNDDFENNDFNIDDNYDDKNNNYSKDIDIHSMKDSDSSDNEWAVV